MNQFPPSPRVSHSDRFDFFRKFAEIFASKGAPCTGINDTGGKFATSLASVVDTGGKFAAGINDTSGNLPPVSTTPAASLPPVLMTPVANNGYNIRLLRP
jgi:hypothetical protein